MDHQVTESELGALLLEDRLIKALRPPGNVRGKSEPDGYVYLRCRLDIPFPILEVAREPAAGHAVCVGPVRGRAAAAELVEQLNSLFGLRHCGRTLPRREHPSAYGQMGRCLSPCLHDLDPNLYRERLDAALKLFVGRDGGPGAARARGPADQGGLGGAPLRARGLAAAAARAARGAAGAARRRAARDAHGRAARARAAPGGRGALRRDLDRGRPRGRLGPGASRRRELAPRSARAFRAAPTPGKLGGWLPADAVAEARLVGAWIAANQPPALELGARTGEAAHAAFLARAGVAYGCVVDSVNVSDLAYVPVRSGSPVGIVCLNSIARGVGEHRAGVGHQARRGVDPADRRELRGVGPHLQRLRQGDPCR